MKKIILITLIVLGTIAIFTGCERNDYQHPLYRSK